MGIDVKVVLPNTTGHIMSTFQNQRFQKKLLQESGDEMLIIVSNAVQSKISSFIKFIWEVQQQLELVTIIK